MASCPLKRTKDYEDWLKIVERQEDVANLPAGWVPAIQFLSFDETGLPLGFLALRLSLNDKLFVEGGHIGYSIRPNQRGKGYGKEQLRLGLAEARKQGLKRMLINTCEVYRPHESATAIATGLAPAERSEERRVGKECRSRWSPYH